MTRPCNSLLFATAVLGAFSAGTTMASSAPSSLEYGARVIHSFGAAPQDITYPSEGPLTLGHDGSFYGAIPVGGTNGSGALFRMTPQGDITVLYSFSAQSVTDGSNADGAAPAGGLVEEADGAFYGVARNGGPHNTGTVLRYRPGTGLKVLYSFGAPTSGSSTNLDGTHPNASLLAADNGTFYGTALSGGRYGAGTIWHLDKDGHFKTIFPFGATNASSGTLAAYPTSGLIAGSDGNFYGVTSSGDPGTGTPGFGTVYRLGRDGQVTVLHWFGVQTPDGQTPYGALVEGDDGLLYGTTTGSTDSLADGSAPAIFRISTDGQYQLLHIGNDQGPAAPGMAIDGLDLYSGLTRGRDGYFYGAMSAGGEFNRGSLFRIGPDGDFVTLYYFGDNYYDGNGNGVSGGVTLGVDGNLYGLTNLGGSRNQGAAYRLLLPAPKDWGSGPDITISASVAPSSISVGLRQTATIQWSSSYARECHVWDGVVGHPARTVAASGSLAVAPHDPGTYRYQVNCEGRGKATDQPAGQLMVTR